MTPPKKLEKITMRQTSTVLLMNLYEKIFKLNRRSQQERDSTIIYIMLYTKKLQSTTK